MRLARHDSAPSTVRNRLLDATLLIGGATATSSVLGLCVFRGRYARYGLSGHLHDLALSDLLLASIGPWMFAGLLCLIVWISSMFIRRVRRDETSRARNRPRRDPATAVARDLGESAAPPRGSSRASRARSGPRACVRRLVVRAILRFSVSFVVLTVVLFCSLLVRLPARFGAVASLVAFLVLAATAICAADLDQVDRLRRRLRVEGVLGLRTLRPIVIATVAVAYLLLVEAVARNGLLSAEVAKARVRTRHDSSTKVSTDMDALVLSHRAGWWLLVEREADGEFARAIELPDAVVESVVYYRSALMDGDDGR